MRWRSRAPAAVALILSGTFEQIIAVATVLFLVNYISAYAALFVLRWREPGLPRPYRAFGFPFTTAIVLVGSVLALIAAAVEDPRSALAAGLLLAACAPIYAWIARRRRLRCDARRRPSCRDSIEIGGQPGLRGMREHALDLRGGGAPDRQRRQLRRAQRTPTSLVSMLGTRAASRELADEKQLVDRIEVLRTIALAIVVHGGELDARTSKPDSSATSRTTLSAGDSFTSAQPPGSVQKPSLTSRTSRIPPIGEHRGADIHLGCGVARLQVESPRARNAHRAPEPCAITAADSSRMRSYRARS